MNAIDRFDEDDNILASVAARLPEPAPAAPVTAPSSRSIDWSLPGFCDRARVGTIFGDLPIEALRVRDELRTNQGTIARVQKVDKIRLDTDFLARNPSALPMLIPASTFAAGIPMQDVHLSPEQMVSSEPHIAARFVKAMNLQGRVNAFRASVPSLTYYRFHCGQPVIVRVEGIWVRVEPW